MSPQTWAAAHQHEAACQIDDRTPFLALHQPTLDANLARAATAVQTRGGVSTPHLKTHKSPEIARRQLAAGSVRATVATMAEADLALRAGFSALLVAYPPVGAHRLDALVMLAERCNVAVTCSRPEHVDSLRSAPGRFEVYWEVDSGTARLGTAPGQATFDAITRCDFDERVRLTALMTFAGFAYSATTSAELAACRDQQDQALADCADLLADVAFGLRRSVGVTPLLHIDTADNNEFRYGNYVFNDTTQVALGAADPGDCALAVISTVIDVRDEHRAILDAGAKAIPGEQMTSLTTGFGAVQGRPGLVLEKLFEEHALCRSEEPHRLRVGERVALVPNHACTAANLHGHYTVVDDSGAIDAWTIAARRP